MFERERGSLKKHERIFLTFKGICKPYIIDYKDFVCDYYSSNENRKIIKELNTFLDEQYSSIEMIRIIPDTLANLMIGNGLVVQFRIFEFYLDFLQTNFKRKLSYLQRSNKLDNIIFNIVIRSLIYENDFLSAEIFTRGYYNGYLLKKLFFHYNIDIKKFRDHQNKWQNIVDTSIFEFIDKHKLLPKKSKKSFKNVVNVFMQLIKIARNMNIKTYDIIDYIIWWSRIPREHMYAFKSMDDDKIDVCLEFFKDAQRISDTILPKINSPRTMLRLLDFTKFQIKAVEFMCAVFNEMIST